MASPQLENGFTPIANELMDALVKVDLSGTEWRVLLLILRQSYGWSRKSADLSHNDIARRTGMSRGAAIKAVKRLIARRMLTKDSIQMDTNGSIQTDTMASHDTHKN